MLSFISGTQTPAIQTQTVRAVIHLERFVLDVQRAGKTKGSETKERKQNANNKYKETFVHYLYKRSGRRQFGSGSKVKECQFVVLLENVRQIKERNDARNILSLLFPHWLLLHS